MDISTPAIWLTALFTGLSAFWLYKASRAPREIYEEQRRDAVPSIVIESRDFWKVDFGSIPFLGLSRPPAKGANVLALGRPGVQGPVLGLGDANKELPRILLRIANVGATAAIDLTVPLKFSWSHIIQDSSQMTIDDPIGRGMESLSQVIDYHIAALPPGEHRVFIQNETGAVIDISSTGEAHDVDPRTKAERKLLASSPIEIVLRTL